MVASLHSIQIYYSMIRSIKGSVKLTWLPKCWQDACVACVACGMGLQKLCVPNWGVVYSFVWCSCSLHYMALVEQRGEGRQVPLKGFVVVGVVCGVCRWLH